MPFAVSCPACQRRFQAKDEWAGKRVKCPGCGSSVTLPVAPAAAAVPQRPSGPADAADDAGAVESTARRKKKRKPARERRPAEPVFSLGSIDFTRTGLIVTLVVLVAVGVGLYFLLGPMFRSGPEVQVVDVYMAVNGLRYTDVGERVLASGTVSYTIPGNRKIVITRTNPEGAFLLVKVNVKDKVLDAHLPRTAGYARLTQGYIQLQGGGETVEAMFIDYRDKALGTGFQLGFSPPQQEKGTPPPLESYLGPGKGEWSAWTHAGQLADNNGILQFRGQGGMQVTTRIGAERFDKSRDGDPLADLGIRKEGGKNLLDQSGLVRGPAAHVHVSWDEGSQGFMITREVERPNDISISWDIDCLFPRPKAGGKDVTLMVFGKAYPIKLP